MRSHSITEHFLSLSSNDTEPSWWSKHWKELLSVLLFLLTLVAFFVLAAFKQNLAALFVAAVAGLSAVLTDMVFSSGSVGTIVIKAHKLQRRLVASLLSLTFTAFALLIIFKQDSATLFAVAGISAVIGLLVIAISSGFGSRKRNNRDFTTVPLLFLIRDIVIFSLSYVGLCFFGVSFSVSQSHGPAVLLNTLGTVWGSTSLVSSAMFMGIIGISMVMAYVTNFIEYRMAQAMLAYDKLVKNASNPYYGIKNRVYLLDQYIEIPKISANQHRITDIVFCVLGILLLAGVITLYAINSPSAVMTCPTLLKGAALLFMVKLFYEGRFFLARSKITSREKRLRIIPLVCGICIFAVLGFVAPSPDIASSAIRTTTLVVACPFILGMFIVGCKQFRGREKISDVKNTFCSNSDSIGSYDSIWSSTNNSQRHSTLSVSNTSHSLEVILNQNPTIVNNTDDPNNGVLSTENDHQESQIDDSGTSNSNPNANQIGSEDKELSYNNKRIK